MKTTVDLPDPLFRRAKATAAVQGISLKSLITQAVEDSLSRPASGLDNVLEGLPVVSADLLGTVARRVAAADVADISAQESAAK
jgi:hypothetical protein